METMLGTGGSELSILAWQRRNRCGMIAALRARINGSKYSEIDTLVPMIFEIVFQTIAPFASIKFFGRARGRY